ncbi:MAG: lysophospholipid acyltransferase family protein [Vicinamibacterales bacterium]
MMTLVRNAAGYGLFAVLLVSFLLANLVVPPQRLLRPVKAMLRLMFRVLGVRVRVVGAERLEEGRAYVYMSNHVTSIDHLIALAYLPGYLVGLEKVEALRVPIYGWAARRWGQVHIDRSDSERAIESCRVIEKRLASGVSIALYPEGTRSHDGRLQPFKKGVFHIAVDTRATVVPIALKGLHRLIPRGSALVRAGKVELCIGAPIAAPEPGPEAVAQLSQQVRAALLARLGGEGTEATEDTESTQRLRCSVPPL